MHQGDSGHQGTHTRGGVSVFWSPMKGVAEAWSQVVSPPWSRTPSFMCHGAGDCGSGDIEVDPDSSLFLDQGITHSQD